MKDAPEISCFPVDIYNDGRAGRGHDPHLQIQVLLEADAKMAERVLLMDDEVDDMNRALQTELVETMQQHPLVTEQLFYAIIIGRNLERAGDHATNIAEDVVFWLRGSDVRHKMSLAEADQPPSQAVLLLSTQPPHGLSW